MYLPEFLNVPRMCQLGGKPYWVRALDLEAFAILVGWHDDTLEHPEPRPAEPPEFGSEAARTARQSLLGQSILVWLGLRHQGVGYEQAKEVFVRASDIELAVFYDILLRRARTWEPSGNSQDLAKVWCDKGWHSLVEFLGSIEAVGRLSLDQLDFIASGGSCDSRSDSEGFEAAMKMFREAKAREEAEKANGQMVEAI